MTFLPSPVSPFIIFPSPGVFPHPEEPELFRIDFPLFQVFRLPRDLRRDVRSLFSYVSWPPTPSALVHGRFPLFFPANDLFLVYLKFSLLLV